MPPVRFADTFFTALALLADAVVALALGGAVAALVSRRARAGMAVIARAVATQAVPLAFVVAAVTTAGSLYYSEYAGYTPCTLCWYQRILMYPLVAILGIAWLRRDRHVWPTVVPFVALGAPVALYHWLVERVPSIASTTSCSLDVPCTSPWFEKLGFVTLAWMSFTAFVLVGTLMAVAVAGRRGGAPRADPPAPEPAHEARPDTTPEPMEPAPS